MAAPGRRLCRRQHPGRARTAYAKLDIGRRAADIGVRSERPVEPNLAGRQVGRVAHAIYAGVNLINGVEAGLFVGVTATRRTSRRPAG